MANIITTSRKPGKNLRKFVRQLSTLFNASYFVRGKSSVNGIFEYMDYEGFKKLVVITEYKGNPKAMLLYGLKNANPVLERRYKITYFKLSEKKIVPASFEFELKEKDNKDLFKYLDVESDDSDYKVIDEKGVISVQKGKDSFLKFKVEKCQI